MSETPEQRRIPSRATEATRAALIKAAVAVFADHGYDNGSVRLITRKASANPAAIAYHFGGKDGLYREALAAAVAAFREGSCLTSEDLDRLAPEAALRSYLREFLSPLVRRDRVARSLRIFAWESVRPSKVFLDFVKSTPPRPFVLAEQLVRRFLPGGASHEDVAVATFWLAQQPLTFIRDAEFLARGPFAVSFADEADLERLVDRLTALCLGGLRGSAAP